MAGPIPPARRVGTLLAAARPAARLASVQVSLQIAALGLGVLIVRTLSVQEYAVYAILVIVNTVLNSLADSGITGTVLSLAGPRRTDLEHLGRVEASARRVRSRLSAAVVVVSAPVCCVLLLRNGTGAASAVLLSVLLVMAFAAAFRASTARALLEAMGSISYVQSARAAGLVVRVAAFVPALAGAPGGLWFLQVGLVLASVVEWLLLDRRVRRAGVVPVHGGEDLRPAFRRSVVRIFPYNAASLLQGQVLGFYLAATSATSTLGTYAALTRFTIVLSLLTLVHNGIVVPWFARRAVGVDAALRLYALMAGAFALALVLAWLVLGAASPLLLAVLGPAYTDDRTAFVVLAAGAGLHELMFGMSQLSQSRGWVSLSWTYPIVGVVSTLVLLAALDVGTVLGAAVFVLLNAVPGLLVNAVQVVASARRERRLQPVTP